MEALLLVADILDGEPGDVLDEIPGDCRGAAGLARDHHAIGGGEGLAGDAQIARIPAIFRAMAEEGVDHLVGNAVADLVRMTFGDGFAGEQISLTGHVTSLQ